MVYVKRGLKPGSKERITRELLLAALDRTDWVIAVAARRLRASRQAVYLAIGRHGIDLSAAPEGRREALRRQRSAAGTTSANRARARARRAAA